MESVQKPYHHGDLKNALITSGLAILRKEGSQSLTLRAVARRAGVSHSAPYSHFENKQELIASIAIAGFQKLIDALTAEPRFTKPRNRKDLLDFAWSYVGFGLDNPDFYTVMFSELTHPAENDDLERISSEAFSILVSGVGAGQQQKLIHKGDPFSIALSIWTSVHGLTNLLISRFIPEPPDRQKGGSESAEDCCPPSREEARSLCDICMEQMYRGLKP